MAMTNPECEQFSLVLSQLLEKQMQEDDQLLQVFNQHLREALQESRSRNTFALVTSAENVSEAIKQKDNELAFANLKTQELHENLQKAIEARDAWQSIAMEKMEMVADLQVTLQNMVTHDAPCFSSTLPQSEEVKVGESTCARPFLPCKLCRYLSACMVFLPCRHLCVCKLCDISVSACPVCNAEKVQSIEVLLSN
ncbi:putative BOI-related E3 ubiquitin-protein ligase 2 [Carex littledalei]|uniref:Putative BOI-related E3 ubiquitin-protein ligase 2 n=1 Tax=Carex littledalei TaxID=544730 RepID=A0A833V4D8_9POAL|nr:putative BOI-related E3 ubiquitin-protein ligase 2 [Carex littledalei]